jgi:hypothetical protein
VRTPNPKIVHAYAGLFCPKVAYTRHDVPWFVEWTNLKLKNIYDQLYIVDDSEHNGRGRASPGSKPPTVTVGSDDGDAEGEAWRRRQGRSRRMSRVTRQHSYDDEIKNTSGGGGNQVGGADAGLGKCYEYL